MLTGLSLYGAKSFLENYKSQHCAPRNYEIEGNQAKSPNFPKTNTVRHQSWIIGPTKDTKAIGVV